MKLVRVIGARPQFMQTAVLSRELEKNHFQEILVHTGQHYDDNMSQCFFDELGISKPDYHLNIGSGLHGAQTAAMIAKVEEILLKEKPDLVVVDGDTNSTAAGALAASKLNMPLVHVEAGLRSYNRSMPEEVNRIIADHLASVLCAPTKQALATLAAEGLDSRATLTGDLMYDCFLHFIDHAKEAILDRLNLQSKQYILATMHRAENVSKRETVLNILLALNEMPLEVVFPCHPGTQYHLATTYQLNLVDYHNIKFIEPVSYLEMLALEKHASCIFTDSGGVQREAYFAQIPSVIIRAETEWTEQLQTGWSVLAGLQTSDILNTYKQLEQSPKQYPLIYGDGHAAANIVSLLARFGK